MMDLDEIYVPFPGLGTVSRGAVPQIANQSEAKLRTACVTVSAGVSTLPNLTVDSVDHLRPMLAKAVDLRQRAS